MPLRIWRKSSCILLLWIKISSVIILNIIEISQNTKYRINIWPRNFSSGFYPNDFKLGCERNICTLKFVAKLFKITMNWEPKSPSVSEWTKTMCHMCTMQHLGLRRRNPVIWESIHESGRWMYEWKKLSREKNTAKLIFFNVESKKGWLTIAKNRMEATRG